MKGVYCLVISLKKSIKLKIGSLGRIRFAKGTYVYVGSAQNNLRRRIKRHFAKKKKFHWHIDYLLESPAVKIRKTFYKEAKKEEECRIASLLNAKEYPIKDFGCSDCRCYSHLFKIKSLKNILAIKDIKEVKKWHIR